MSLSELFRCYYAEAAKVSVSVGTILLLINQHDALFGQREIQWMPALLTYCVPFCVFMLGKRSSGQSRTKSLGLDVPISRYR